MVSQMMAIPPMRGATTLNSWVVWGLGAFLLAVILVVVLWAVWVVKSQQRTARPSERNEAQRPDEAFQPPQRDEHTPVCMPEQENVRIPSLT